MTRSIAGSASVTALAPLLLGVGLLVFGTNLQGVLVTSIGHERGSGMLAIGLFSAGWSAGFVAACLCVGHLLSRLGHVRSFALLAVLSGMSALLLASLPRDADVVLLRIVIGFCYGGLSAIAEGWLLEQAGSGPAFASYMIVNLLASLAGTLSLNLLPPGRPACLLTGAAVIASMLPPPPPPSPPRPPPPMPPSFRPQLGHLLRASPIGAFGCLVVGLITGSLGGLGPIFGMMAGLSMRADTLMLAANSIGGALAYAPVGLLSGRVDRRTLLMGIALFGLLVCLPLIVIHDLSPGLVILLLGAFGLAQYPLYGLCVGLANLHLPDRPATQTSTELLLVFGVGTIVGPLISGQIMRTGAEHLFTFIAALLVVLVIAVASDRTWLRQAASPDD